MRNKYYFLYFIMFLTLAITVGAIYVFPDTIPLQYDSSGVSRFGSKYELLLYASIFTLIELGAVIYGKFESKKSEYGTNEKPAIYSAIAVSAFYLVIEIYIIYITYSYSKENKIAFNMDTLSLIVCISLGVVFCVIGNVLPKTSESRLLGFHTLLSDIWVSSSDDTWKKTQRFCGIVLVLCGIFIIIGAIIFKLYVRVIFTAALIVVAIIVCYIMSIYIYRKGQKGN